MSIPRIPFQKAREAYPERINIGKKWSHVEEEILLKRISEGKTIEEIATEFKRTNGGIRARLIEHACNLIIRGKTIDEAAQVTTIDKTRINECLPARIFKHERKMEKKSKSVVALPITAKPQSDDFKELLSLTREVHVMLKELLSEKYQKKILPPHPPPPPPPPTIIKKPIMIVRAVKAVKAVKPQSSCMVQDDN